METNNPPSRPPIDYGSTIYALQVTKIVEKPSREPIAELSVDEETVTE